MNDDGFEEWYAREHARLLAAVTVMVGDVDLAAEVVDEACVRALERWRNVQRMHNPTGWVYRVAVNRAHRAHRRRDTERRLLAARARDMDAAVPPPGDLEPELWAAVRALAPRARAAIALRYVAGLTEREVAEAMKVAPGTVARMLHDARRQLAVVLVEREAPDAREEAGPCLT